MSRTPTARPVRPTRSTRPVDSLTWRTADPDTGFPRGAARSPPGSACQRGRARPTAMAAAAWVGSTTAIPAACSTRSQHFAMPARPITTTFAPSSRRAFAPGAQTHRAALSAGVRGNKKRPRLRAFLCRLCVQWRPEPPRPAEEPVCRPAVPPVFAMAIRCGCADPNCLPALMPEVVALPPVAGVTP